MLLVNNKAMVDHLPGHQELECASESATALVKPHC